MNNDKVKFLLNWNHFGDHLSSCMTKLMSDSSYSDIIIATGDKRMIYSHRFVLASSSKYFQRLLKHINKQNGIQLVVALPEIKYDIFKILMNYMYKGETQVPHELLPQVIKAGQFLEIYGLVNLNENGGESSEVNKQTSAEVRLSNEVKTRTLTLRDKVHLKENTAKSILEKKPKKSVEEESLNIPENGKENKSKSARAKCRNLSEEFIQLPLKRKLYLRNSAKRTEKTKRLGKGTSIPPTVSSNCVSRKKMPKLLPPPELLKVNVKTEMPIPDVSNIAPVNELGENITIKTEAPDEIEDVYNQLQCDFCHEVYSNPPEWVKHMTDQHGDRGFQAHKELEKNAERNTMITCVVCSFVCFSPAEWAEHLRVWHSERELVLANMKESQKNFTKPKKNQQLKNGKDN